MPSDTFRHTVAVPASPGDVWKALQQADTWSGIGPIDEVWDAEHDEDGGLLGYRWSAAAAGRIWKGTARLVDARRPERMTLTLRTDEMRGSITTDLSPGPVGTDLAVTLHAEATGMLATLFWGVVVQAIGRGFPKQVDGFRERF
jgi:hypothetical protein